jgi:hypothetical protein
MPADLFSVTAPLVIRLPSGEKRLMVERFPHPRGLLYFEPFWDAEGGRPGVHVVEGEIRGDGPWKVGDAVITVLSCADSALNMEWNGWRQALADPGAPYHDCEAVLAAARARGAEV